MKLPALLAGAALASAALWYAPLFQSGPSPAGLVPAGPLLCLEARDFGRQLHDWNTSAVKPRWLASANYSAFSRSRLFLRLREVWEAFGAAAGFTPDMRMLESVAGGESALALYDIARLEFLYVTRMPAARVAESVVWQKRAGYEERQSAGFPFYVRRQQGATVLAFASAKGFLILGTREEFVAGALRLLAGEAAAALKDDAWYAQTTAASGAPGDLRLTLNLEALVRSPYFRAYWIQRNTSEVRQYWAGLCDLRRGSTAVTEDRLLLRKQPVAAPGGTVAQMLPLVPDEAGLYRAWTEPDPKEMALLIARKLYGWREESASPSRFAPAAPEEMPQAGVESDLETRIDEQPLDTGRRVPALDPIRALLAAVPVRAALAVQTSRTAPSGAFIELPAAIVLEGARPWDLTPVRAAISAGADGLWSTAGLGLGWVERQRAGQTVWELDGLAPLAIAANGRLLVLANSPDLAAAVAARAGLSGRQVAASFAAGFRHAAERARFIDIMSALERGRPGFSGPFMTGPRLFSGNVASLSAALSSLASEQIIREDRGSSVTETVLYELK